MELINADMIGKYIERRSTTVNHNDGSFQDFDLKTELNELFPGFELKNYFAFDTQEGYKRVRILMINR